MPPTFDRFMIAVELGHNQKILRFSDAEFRCLITGVWALAAKTKPRGCLTVGGQPATERDIAGQAHCSVAIAKRTIDKMRALGMLEYDSDCDWFRVHDWDDVQPAPKKDPTNAARQRRHRLKQALARNGKSNAESNASNAHEDARARSSTSTSSLSSTEASEDNNGRDDARALFDYWRERCNHPSAKFTAERRQKVEARRREGYSVDDVRKGIDGAALNPPTDRESGFKHDDLVSVCRNGAQLERYMARADARPNVVPMRRESASDLLRAINPDGAA